MLCHQLGFCSSWKMLIRNKGWMGDMLLLTLVSFIPIVGQIAVFGYGFEWARLTAWGFDATPKQSGVKIGKLLRTGAAVFLVVFTMLFVVSACELILFGAQTAVLSLPMFSVSMGALALSGMSLVGIAVMLAASLLFGTLINAAALRATIYDSVAAGWRLDRLFQMVTSDASGFFKLYLVSLLTGVATWLYSTLSTMLLGVALMETMAATGVAFSAEMSAEELSEAIFSAIVSMDSEMLFLLMLGYLAIAFVGNAVGIIASLISINATGQWFCRFDLPRWDVSSAPLPSGVPLDFHDDAMQNSSSE